jgi:hypothetical protein
MMITWQPRRFLLSLLALAASIALVIPVNAALAEGSLKLVAVNPTPFFPKVKEGEPFQQRIELELENPGKVELAAEVRITLEGQPTVTRPLGQVQPGKSVVPVLMPDISRPTTVRFEIAAKDFSRPFGATTHAWFPQKKWTVYNVAYSHHDLGYADYFHLMRRDVREMGIELALEYCQQTDSWDTNSQFRWTVETSEPLAQWIRHNSRERVDELARRIREGRIELGALHSSVSAEMLSPELMARLFYTPNRHIVDMLGIPPQSTALLNDVEGFPRSLPTYLKEAGIPYFFHGRNGLEDQMRPASANPAYYWMGTDGDRERLPIFLTLPYHCSEHQGDLHGLGESYIKDWIQSVEQSTWLEKIPNRKIPDWMASLRQSKWPADCLLSRECWDFSLPVFDNSKLIRNWNQKWSYPRVINATMTMFVRDLVSQLDKDKMYLFEKDAPNSWSDQHYADLEATAWSRRTGNTVPDLEKLASVASALGSRMPLSLSFSSAYQHLLVYDEHTMGAYSEGSVQPPPTLKNEKAALEFYYEAERSMHHALAEEARDLAQQTSAVLFAQLDRMMPSSSGVTLVVYNTLARIRTDVVQVETAGLVWPFHLVDNMSHQEIPCQRMPDDRILFLARDVPSLGYKTYRVVRGAGKRSPAFADMDTTALTLENQYYKITFNPKSGVVAGIWDKELGLEIVDVDASWQVNEYLYQYEGNSETAAGWYRTQSAKLTKASGAVASVMTVEAKATGLDALRQQVILYNDLKRIDFINDLQKAPSGRTFQDYKKGNNVGKESVYFAIPLHVPRFKIHHELAGAVVEPIADQSVGSTTSFYGIQHFTDFSNDQFGVTVGTVECGLVEYGTPRHSEPWRNESIFKQPERSHLFLYAMNNWFGTNIPVDQRGGPYRVTYALRSHKGDWRQGEAFLLGGDVSSPLLARVVESPGKGTLRAQAMAFLELDQSNVAVSTFKAAEANGMGLILRLSELMGRATKLTITLPLLKSIASATETSLLEVDRPLPLPIQDGNRILLAIAPHGVKTLRIVCGGSPPQVQSLTARPVADMCVDLTWRELGPDVVRFDVYRDTTPDYAPSPRFLIGQTGEAAYVDKPHHGFGIWQNRLEPATTYYYKVVAADRWNNLGPASTATQATTLSSQARNSNPVQVRGLHAFSVSPVGQNHFAGLWFYTNPESDVVQYRIHRHTRAGFKPEDENLLMSLDVRQTFRHITPHGFKTVDRQLREYDRQVVADESTAPGTTYFYRVCAVDAAGQRGAFSEEASVKTKPVESSSK